MPTFAARSAHLSWCFGQAKRGVGASSPVGQVGLVSGVCVVQFTRFHFGNSPAPGIVDSNTSNGYPRSRIPPYLWLASWYVLFTVN